jgi:hypothetical protein
MICAALEKGIIKYHKSKDKKSLMTFHVFVNQHRLKVIQAGDAIEKITCTHPQLPAPHKDHLITISGSATVKEQQTYYSPNTYDCFHTQVCLIRSFIKK